MSRAYRISVSETIRRNIRVEDGFQAKLELLSVLSSGEMAELLAAQLEPLGFERDGQTMRRVDDDGVEVTIDLDEGTVTARIAAEKKVVAEVERSRRIYEEHIESGREKLRESVRAELEREVEKERRELSAEVTELLERKLRDLRAELDKATNRATAEALKVRAKQMGEVKEISENPETGEITIKVEV